MAADLTQSFWGKHFEKIIVGAAGVIFIAALALFALLRSNEDKVRLEVVQLKQRIVEAQHTSKLEKALTAEESASLGLNRPLLTVAEYADRLNGLPPAWNPDKKDVVEGIVEPQKIVEPNKNPYEAPKVEAVTDLQAVTGRGVTDEQTPYAVYKLEGRTTLSDVLWAGGGGVFDLTAQLEDYRKANLDQPQPIILSRLDFQRRERKPDGTWSDWKAVSPVIPAALAAKWPKLPANLKDLRAVREWGAAVEAMQADVRRMPLYHMVVTDEEGQVMPDAMGPAGLVEQPEWKPPTPAPEAAAPAAGPAATAAPAPAAPTAAPAPAAGGSPWGAPPPAETAPATFGGGIKGEQVVAPHVFAKLWAYDASVEPGKTYQYHMRVSIRSPFWSEDRAKPEVRWTPEFTGDWSKAGPDVTIPNLVDFYFIGSFGDKANLELHRWILGQWVIVRSAPTSLGGPVAFTKARTKLHLPGSTGEEVIKDVDLVPGVLLVDILRNFPYVPEGANRAIRTNVLVFTDSRGELQHRIEWDDKKEAVNSRQKREGGMLSPPPPPTPTPKTPKKRP